MQTGEGCWRRLWLAALIGAIAATAPGPVSPVQAQEEVAAPDPVVGDSLAPDSIPPGVSPPGAFLRGAIIPGWGHMATGSLTRGAFYFGWETLTGWMIFKSHRRMGAARRRATLWEDQLTARLLGEGVAPEEVDAQLENDPELRRLRGLADARGEQREDWLAVGIFTMLLSGVDAFVSTHLQDFPEPLTVEGDPITGTVEVSVRLPVGRW